MHAAAAVSWRSHTHERTDLTLNLNRTPRACPCIPCHRYVQVHTRLSASNSRASHTLASRLPLQFRYDEGTLLAGKRSLFTRDSNGTVPFQVMSRLTGAPLARLGNGEGTGPGHMNFPLGLRLTHDGMRVHGLCHCLCCAVCGFIAARYIVQAHVVCAWCCLLLHNFVLQRR